MRPDVTGLLVDRHLVDRYLVDRHLVDRTFWSTGHLVENCCYAKINDYALIECVNFKYYAAEYI